MVQINPVYPTSTFPLCPASNALFSPFAPTESSDDESKSELSNLLFPRRVLYSVGDTIIHWYAINAESDEVKITNKLIFFLFLTSDLCCCLTPLNIDCTSYYSQGSWQIFIFLCAYNDYLSQTLLF